jgi:small conductance mechanosensitive channel
LAIVEAEAEKLRQDPTWGKLILEPPLLLGVDHLDHGGATLRIWIKTIPLKQWDVGREYRRRLMMAMEQSQIKIGIPQQIIQISGRSGAPVNGRGQPGPSLTEVG